MPDSKFYSRSRPEVPALDGYFYMTYFASKYDNTKRRILYRNIVPVYKVPEWKFLVLETIPNGLYTVHIDNTSD